MKAVLLYRKQSVFLTTILSVEIELAKNKFFETSLQYARVKYIQGVPQKMSFSGFLALTIVF